MTRCLRFAESNRSNLTLHHKSAGFAATDDPFHIEVERSGATNYNVSWTVAEKSGIDNRAARYVVTWYDADDGQELGSVSTAADKRHAGQFCLYI